MSDIKNLKIFICEGDKDECYLNYLFSSFFSDSNIKIITLNVRKNIYMLYNILKSNNFIDLIELLKEDNEFNEQLINVHRQDVSEIFLFFDLDKQQNNLSKKYQNADDILEEMLSFFDNETENGKLYLSYPMLESVRDFKKNKCDTFTGCVVDYKDCSSYKPKSGDNNPNAHIKKYDKNTWNETIKVFLSRLCCLFDLETINEKQYNNKISPINIFLNEKEKYFPKIFVLSAFPEFLLDYYKWSVLQIKHFIKIISYDICPKTQ